MTDVSICALVAAFDEEATVRQVVRGTVPHVSRVVVVDDGSTDRTAQIARDAGATVLLHERNLGKGCAIRTGLSYILEQPHTHVLFLDGDLQHDPTEIPKLVERSAKGTADFVLGEREFSREAMPPARFYSNVIGSRILSSLIGVEIADSQSGFRLIRTDLLRKVLLTATGYEIETEMLIKLTRVGARVERVGVHRLRYDGARSKMRPVRDTFRTCMLALRYRFLA
ncbi:MAG TPA: glycosyltransferase family 2 protein [Vicinamibacterales bacterium]|nr:glycosyltransferase family 2 protein [Vicinamibacterales bacterium]